VENARGGHERSPCDPAAVPVAILLSVLDCPLEEYASAMRAVLAAFVAFLAALPTRPAESLVRCEGGIVRVGDGREDLLAKCGGPVGRSERLAMPGVPLQQSAGVVSTVEEWTYGLGPYAAMLVSPKDSLHVTLEGGKVVAIEGDGGHALSPLRSDPAGGGRRCAWLAIRVGDKKDDLLARCGEPDFHQPHLEDRSQAAPRGSPAAHGVRSVRVEVWTYYLPGVFLQLQTQPEHGRANDDEQQLFSVRNLNRGSVLILDVTLEESTVVKVGTDCLLVLP